MQLKEWLNAEHGRASALAKRLGVTRSMVSQMIRDDAPIRVPPKHYRAIRDFTGSEVTLEDLVPEAHG
jgi:DNA-binding transcriptional regulator YdaS (Cro superfamily)